jgi:hypothetical protein
MIRSIFLLAIIFVTSQVGHAQANTDEVSKKEILQVNQEWNNAIIRRDSATLEKILAPEFTLNGDLPRSEWMNNTLHRLETSALKNVEEPTITIYGLSAVSTSTIYWKATFDGRPIDNEFTVIDVWKKNNGKWQVLIRMSRRR